MGVVFEYYRNELQNKYENIIINKWFIWVILILVIILILHMLFIAHQGDIALTVMSSCIGQSFGKWALVVNDSINKSGFY